MNGTIREYEEGMFRGAGYDSLSGRLRGDAIGNHDALEEPEAKGQKIWFQLKQVKSSQELVKHLDVSTSASINAGLFGGGSIKAKFASAQKINKYCVYALVQVIVQNPARRIRKPKLSIEANNLLEKQGAEAFRRTYGDEFVVGVITGGEYFALLEVIAEDEQQKAEISASIRAKEGTWKLGGDFQNSLSSIASRYQLNVYEYLAGGEPSIAITFKDMIAKAVDFPRQVKGENAAMFQVIVLDYEAIPKQVDLINVTHQKQIIDKLWQYRLKCFDTLSNIEYVLDHRELFESFEQATLKDQAARLRVRINELTDMVISCANDYKACKLPEVNYRLPQVLLPPQKGVQYYHLVAFSPNSSSLSARQWLHHQYYDLLIRCPACLADGKDGGIPSQWYHNDCGGKMQIGDNANLRCEVCGDNSSSHIKNWRYRCSAHATEFRATTSAHFATAASTAGQLTDIAGVKWLIRLLENLGDDW